VFCLFLFVYSCVCVCVSVPRETRKRLRREGGKWAVAEKDAAHINFFFLLLHCVCVPFSHRDNLVFIFACSCLRDDEGYAGYVGQPRVPVAQYTLVVMRVFFTSLSCWFLCYLGGVFVSSSVFYCTKSSVLRWSALLVISFVLPSL
jgi:hypothetical protein